MQIRGCARRPRIHADRGTEARRLSHGLGRAAPARGPSSSACSCSREALSSPSPKGRSRSSPPSPTKRSSPSRTPACLEEVAGPDAETFRRLSTIRPPRATCSTSSAGRRPSCHAGLRRDREDGRCTSATAEYAFICAAAGRARATWLAANNVALAHIQFLLRRARPRSAAIRSSGASRSRGGRSMFRTCWTDPEYKRARLAEDRQAADRARRAASSGTAASIGVLILARTHGAAVHRQAGQPRRDLRGPGRHRDRKCPAVRGGPGAHERACALRRGACAPSARSAMP